MRLIDLITLIHEGEDCFSAAPSGVEGTRPFGGLLLARALTAALHTMNGISAHSLHASFLRAGDNGRGMTLDVERLRDGRRFVTRQVTARQGDRKLLVATVSGHVEEDGGLEHQISMPQVPPPEGLISEHALRAEAVATGGVTWVRPLEMQQRIELRPVKPRDFLNPRKTDPEQHFWARPVEPVPDDPILAQAVLAYISDMMMLSTAMLPHGIYWATTPMESASLDHAVWFHRKPCLDDWLLWSIEAPWAGKARAYARGAFFDRSGRLIASAAQEGLLRLR